MNIGLIIAIVIGVLVVAFAAVIFIFVLKKPGAKNEAKVEHTYTLAELKSLAEIKESEQSLEELVDIFLATQTLPSRRPSQLTQDVSSKLDFIGCLVLNPNINAKLIVKLTKALKAKYPAFKADIEAAEQIAIAKRRMRE